MRSNQFTQNDVEIAAVKEGVDAAEKQVAATAADQSAKREEAA